MNLYRITREKYGRDLTGEGARLFGGRWNNKGNAVLYTAEHASLAALEVLVNSPINMLPSDLVLVELFVDHPADPDIILAEDLGRDWKSYPAPNFLKEIGDSWIQSRPSLLMKVPSVIIPEEYNMLVNPKHSAIDTVRVNSIKPFRFDQRLFE
ncbi:RES family NAD+ phosphorylase [soil metagenome]